MQLASAINATRTALRDTTARGHAALLTAAQKLVEAATPFMTLALAVEHGWQELHPVPLASTLDPADAAYLNGTGADKQKLAVHTASIMARGVYELDRALAPEYATDADGAGGGGDNRNARAQARVTALTADSAIGYAVAALKDASLRYAAEEKNNAPPSQAATNMFPRTLRALLETLLRDAGRRDDGVALNAEAWKNWVATLATTKADLQQTLDSVRDGLFATDKDRAKDAARALLAYVDATRRADQSAGGGASVGTNAALLALLDDLVGENQALRCSVQVVNAHARASDRALGTLVLDVLTPPSDDAAAVAAAAPSRQPYLSTLFEANGALASASALPDDEEFKHFEGVSGLGDERFRRATTLAHEVMWTYLMTDAPNDVLVSINTITRTVYSRAVSRLRDALTLDDRKDRTAGLSECIAATAKDLARRRPNRITAVPPTAANARARILLCSAVLWGVRHFRVPPTDDTVAIQALMQLVDDAKTLSAPESAELSWVGHILGDSRAGMETEWRKLCGEWETAWPGTAEGKNATTKNLAVLRTAAAWMRHKAWLERKEGDHKDSDADAKGPAGDEPDESTLSEATPSVLLVLQAARAFFERAHVAAWKDALSALSGVMVNAGTSWASAAARAYLFATAGAQQTLPYPALVRDAFRGAAIPAHILDATNGRLVLDSATEARAWRAQWANDAARALNATQFADSVHRTTVFLRDAQAARELMRQRADAMRTLAADVVVAVDTLRAASARHGAVARALWATVRAPMRSDIQAALTDAARGALTDAQITALYTNYIRGGSVSGLTLGQFAAMFAAQVYGTAASADGFLAATQTLLRTVGAALARMSYTDQADARAAAVAAAAVAAGTETRAFPWVAALQAYTEGAVQPAIAGARASDAIRLAIADTAASTRTIATRVTSALAVNNVADATDALARAVRANVAYLVGETRNGIEAYMTRQREHTSSLLNAAVRQVAAEEPAPAFGGAPAVAPVAAAAAADDRTEADATEARTLRTRMLALSVAMARTDRLVRETWPQGMTTLLDALARTERDARPWGISEAFDTASGLQGAVDAVVLDTERVLARVGESARAYDAARTAARNESNERLRAALARFEEPQARLMRAFESVQSAELVKDLNRRTAHALLRWGAHFQHLVEHWIVGHADAEGSDETTHALLDSLKEQANYVRVFDHFAGYRDAYAAPVAAAGDYTETRKRLGVGAVRHAILQAIDMALVNLAARLDRCNGGPGMSAVGGNDACLQHLWSERQEPPKPNRNDADNPFFTLPQERVRYEEINLDTDHPRFLVNLATKASAAGFGQADYKEAKELNADHLAIVEEYASAVTNLVKVAMRVTAYTGWHRVLRNTSTPMLPEEAAVATSTPGRWDNRTLNPDAAGWGCAAYILAMGTAPVADAKSSEVADYDVYGRDLMEEFALHMDTAAPGIANEFAARCRGANPRVAVPNDLNGVYPGGGGRTVAFHATTTLGDALCMADAPIADARFRTRLRWLSALVADTYSGASRSPEGAIEMKRIADEKTGALVPAHWRPTLTIEATPVLGARGNAVRSALVNLRMHEAAPGAGAAPAGAANWRTELRAARGWWFRLLRAHMLSAELSAQEPYPDVQVMQREIQYAERVAAAMRTVANEAYERARDHFNALMTHRKRADAFMQWVADAAVAMLARFASAPEMRALASNAAPAVRPGALRVAPDGRLFAWSDPADARAWAARLSGEDTRPQLSAVVMRINALEEKKGDEKAADAVIEAARAYRDALDASQTRTTQLYARAPSLPEVLQEVANDFDTQWANLYARLRAAWPEVRPEEAEEAARARAAALADAQRRLTATETSLRTAKADSDANREAAGYFTQLREALVPLVDRYERTNGVMAALPRDRRRPAEAVDAIRRWVEFIATRAAVGDVLGGGGGGGVGAAGGAAGVLARIENPAADLVAPVFHVFVACAPGSILDRFAHWLTLVQGAAAISNVTRMFNESALNTQHGGVVLTLNHTTAEALASYKEGITGLRRALGASVRTAGLEAMNVPQPARDEMEHYLEQLEAASSSIANFAASRSTEFANRVRNFEHEMNHADASMHTLWPYLRYVLSPPLYAHVVRGALLFGSEKTLMRPIVEDARDSTARVWRYDVTRKTLAPLAEPMDTAAAVYDTVLANPRLVPLAAELLAVSMRRSELEVSGSRVVDSDGVADMGRARGRTGTAGHVSTAMLVEQMQILDHRQRLLAAAFERECVAAASESGAGGGGWGGI